MAIEGKVAGRESRPRSKPAPAGTSREAANEPPTRSVAWPPEQGELLERRRKLAWGAQQAYFERASILNALNYLIGIPVVVVTVLAGSEIVASHATNEPVPIWVGFITVSAAVLASLQTFFRFGERAAFSAAAGNQYATIRRRIEDALVHPTPNPTKEFGDIRTLMDDAGKQLPPIGERRWLTWQTFSEWERPPSLRPWWRAMFGFPPSRRRRSRSSQRERDPRLA